MSGSCTAVTTHFVCLVSCQQKKWKAYTGTWKLCLPAGRMTDEDESLQVRSYRTLEELQNLQPAWEELLSSYPLATTFSTWEWLSAWWHAFGKGRELLVLAFF